MRPFQKKNAIPNPRLVKVHPEKDLQLKKEEQLAWSNGSLAEPRAAADSLGMAIINRIIDNAAVAVALESQCL